MQPTCRLHDRFEMELYLVLVYGKKEIGQSVESKRLYHCQQSVEANSEHSECLPVHACAVML